MDVCRILIRLRHWRIITRKSIAISSKSSRRKRQLKDSIVLLASIQKTNRVYACCLQSSDFLVKTNLFLEQEILAIHSRFPHSPSFSSHISKMKKRLSKQGTKKDGGNEGTKEGMKEGRKAARKERWDE